MPGFVTLPGPSISEVKLGGLSIFQLTATLRETISDSHCPEIEINTLNAKGWRINSASRLCSNGFVYIRRLNADGSWHSLLTLSGDTDSGYLTLGTSQKQIGYVSFSNDCDVHLGPIIGEESKRAHVITGRHLAIPQPAYMRSMLDYRASGVSQMLDLNESRVAVFCEHQTTELDDALCLIGRNSGWPCFRFNRISIVYIKGELRVMFHPEFNNPEGPFNSEVQGFLKIPESPQQPIEIFNSEGYFTCTANVMHEDDPHVEFLTHGYRWKVSG